MRMRRRQVWAALAVLAALSGAVLPNATTAQAQSAALPVPAAPIPFRTFLEQVWTEAKAQGVSRATFDAALKGVEPDMSLPDLVLPGAAGRETKAQQAEFVRSPAEYLNPKTLGNLIASGLVLDKKWDVTLAGIDQKYGVPRAMVLAIWGRETAYGTYKPPHYAIKVLATQAYLGRRKEKFREELILALKMIEERHVTIPEFKASWAGAFGLTQFLPNDFYKFAVDFDGDGKRDLLHSVPDALASAAVQLSKYGWERDKPWGWEARAPANPDCSLEGLAHVRPLRDWLKLGYTRVDAKARMSAEALDVPTMLLMPAGTYGPAFLTTNNFQVIKAYNFADLYALFVGHLADRMAGGAPFVQAWGAVTPTPEKDAMEMQTHLRAAGFEIEKIDGKVGTKTRSALGSYQKRHSLKLDCWPTPATLQLMRQVAQKLGAPGPGGGVR
jgi:lytic murein transglycosylase